MMTGLIAAGAAVVGALAGLSMALGELYRAVREHRKGASKNPAGQNKNEQLSRPAPEPSAAGVQPQEHPSAHTQTPPEG
jgi:hypothetical protein